MKALVSHDRDGRITRIVTAPPDAPPIHMAGRPGELVSEVELPEFSFDVSTPEGVEQMLKELRNYRVDFDRHAKLVAMRGES